MSAVGEKISTALGFLSVTHGRAVEVETAAAVQAEHKALCAKEAKLQDEARTTHTRGGP